MKHAPWIVGLIAALGCGGSKKSTGPSGSAAPRQDPVDALWRQAPAGASAAMVVAPGALADLHRGLIEVAGGSLRSTKLGGEAIAEVIGEAASADVDVMSPAGFDSLGLDLTLGAAAFAVGDDSYTILPVTDREAFARRVGASLQNGVDVAPAFDLACAMGGGFYRCAPTPDKLAAWKPSGDGLRRRWMGDDRGAIELYMAASMMADAKPLVELLGGAPALRLSLVLSRGELRAGFSLLGALDPSLHTGPTPLADAAMKGNPAGVLVASLGPILELVSEPIDAELARAGASGLSVRSLLDTITGEVTAHLSPGKRPRGSIEVGITRPEALRVLLPLCAGAEVDGLSFKQLPDGCLITVAEELITPPLEVSVTIEDRAVVATIGEGKSAGAGDGPPPSIAGQRWTAALWARGSMLASFNSSPAFVEGLDDPEAALGAWALGHVSELALGVRADPRGVHGLLHVATTWRNPPAVVARLEPLMTRFVGGDMGSLADIEALGRANAGSPLATDVSLGSNGMMAVLAGIGLVAGIAAPTFAADPPDAQLLAEFEAVKDKMCACADKACAEKVNRDFEQWLQRNQNTSPSASARQRAMKIAEAYTKCMMKAMSNP